MTKHAISAHVREQQINSLPNITFVRWDGEYRNAHSKAVCRCTADGFEWSAAVTNLTDGRQGCPRCAGNQKRTAQCQIDQINKLPNVTFVRWEGVYRNSKSRAVCRCDIDGCEWSAAVGSMTTGGKGCPQCGGGVRRWSESGRVEQINKLTNVTFVRWDTVFRGARSKVVCCCDNGHEWVATVYSLLSNGSGCPQCAGYGYNPSKPGTLYALRSECGTMVKVGISNNARQRHAILKRKTPFAFNCVELCHGDGAMVATLEKVLHGLMEPVVFDTPFDGSTEWRKWDARLPEWFDLYRHWS